MITCFLFAIEVLYKDQLMLMNLFLPVLSNFLIHKSNIWVKFAQVNFIAVYFTLYLSHYLGYHSRPSNAYERLCVRIIQEG